MTDREFLRHSLATLAYRASKTLRGAPETFATYKAGPTSKTPLQIVAHLGDLFEWALTMVMGAPNWNPAVPQTWDIECARFFEALKKFDDYLASDLPIRHDNARIFQGPVADAFTHTGQLAMLRRLHGSPIKSESYSRAEIVIGRVELDQPPPDPKFEFD